MTHSFFETFNPGQFPLRHFFQHCNVSSRTISRPALLSTLQRSLPDEFMPDTSFNTATFTPGRLYARHFLQYCNIHSRTSPQFSVTYQSQVRKQKNTNIVVFVLCIYFHPFTYIQCINDIHYAASCFSIEYLLPLLSLSIDPKYAVVPSCLFL